MIGVEVTITLGYPEGMDVDPVQVALANLGDALDKGAGAMSASQCGCFCGCPCNQPEPAKCCPCHRSPRRQPVMPAKKDALRSIPPQWRCRLCGETSEARPRTQAELLDIEVCPCSKNPEGLTRRACAGRNT